VSNPRRANGSKRDKVCAQVKREEDDCWLCGEPVDKTLGLQLGVHSERCKREGRPDCTGCVPHPMRGEVDEIVPVRDGGSPFDRSNCRLTHRLCNRYRDTKKQPPRAAMVATERHWW
jgi:hypothetical protein